MRPVVAAPFLVVVALLASPGSAEGVSAHRRTETRPGNPQRTETICGTIDRGSVEAAAGKGHSLSRGVARERELSIAGGAAGLAPVCSLRTRRRYTPTPPNHLTAEIARPSAASSLSSVSRSWLRPALNVAPSSPPLAAQPKSPSAPPTASGTVAGTTVVAEPAQDVGRTVTRGGAVVGNATAPLSALQLKIRWCESRDNYQAQNAASTASGGWQFLDTTWHSNSHLPGHARDYSPAVQDRVFLLVFAEQGTRPWVSSESCWR